MKEKIRKHINGLFTEAPKTRKAMELKEEMIQNTIEKYEDLVSEGYQEADALQNVIDSIGDVTELFEDLKDKSLFTLPEKDRKKKAGLTAAAVGMYIFAGAVFVACRVINDMYFYMGSEMGMLGFALAAVLCIPPTCMLVYGAHMYPVYNKKEESLVEVYKEAAHASSQEKAVKRSISLIIWMVTLLVYFLLSFFTMRWELTWLMIFVGGCAQAILNLVFSLRHDS